MWLWALSVSTTHPQTMVPTDSDAFELARPQQDLESLQILSRYFASIPNIGTFGACSFWSERQHSDKRSLQQRYTILATVTELQEFSTSVKNTFRPRADCWLGISESNELASLWPVIALAHE